MKKKKERVKIAVHNYMVYTCPHCKREVEDYIGRVDDITIFAPDEEGRMECEVCEEEFDYLIE